MRKTGVVIGLLTMLAACGDPLAGIGRISDVDLVENDASAQALPSEQEIAREGFFGTDAAEPTNGIVLDGAALEDTVNSETGSSTASLERAKTSGTPIVAEPPRRGGLLGLLSRVVPAARSADGGADDTLTPDAFQTAKAAEGSSLDAPTELASLSPTIEPNPLAEPAPVPPKRGLFARFNKSQPTEAPKSGMPEVDYGTVLPYGVIARNCAATRQPLGRKVDAVRASGYDLYDSNSGASGPRTFYITGFDDGCPRQLTAAHVLLGEPSFYEQLHYGPTGQHLAFGATDRAYEAVKRRICGVGKGKPCGSKMGRLESKTVFVNSYELLDDNTRWSEQLIHDGEVMATSIKSSG